MVTANRYSPEHADFLRDREADRDAAESAEQARAKRERLERLRLLGRAAAKVVEIEAVEAEWAAKYYEAFMLEVAAQVAEVASDERPPMRREALTLRGPR